MDTAVWQEIFANFPVPATPPVYEMLGISLTSRLAVAVVPLGVVRSPAGPLLRMVVPTGTVPPSRVRPRSGPIVFKHTLSCRVSETLEGDPLLDPLGEVEYIDVILIDALPTVAGSMWRVLDPRENPDVVGYRAHGPDPEEVHPEVPVWPWLVDLLEEAQTIPDRPHTFYSASELADLAGEAPYATAESAADDLATQRAPASLRPPPLQDGAPVIGGLDPAEVRNALQAGVPLGDLEAFSRVAALIPPGARAPISGARADRVQRPPPEIPPLRAAALPPKPPVQAPGSCPAPLFAASTPPADFFSELRDALRDGLRGGRPEEGRSGLERALEGIGGGSSDSSGGLSLRKGAEARLKLSSALVKEPSHFTDYVDQALEDAFPSRASGSVPTMREYVEHRSRFSSHHRASLLTAWSVAGARDALRWGRPGEALARLDTFIIALEQASIDGGSWLLGAEMLWESEPPSVVSSGSNAMDTFRRPTSALCDPRWAEVAYYRIRDLDDWQIRRQRLASSLMGKGKGRGKGKDDQAPDAEDPGGPPARGGPSPRRKAKAKPKVAPP